MTKILLAIATTLLCHASPPRQEPKSDITDKEATDLARKIEVDHVEGRETEFDALLDIERMIEDGAVGLDLKAAEKKDFLEGFRSSSLGKSIGVAQGFSCHFLRMRRVDGKTLLRFRLWSTGVTYVDLHVVRTPAGLRIGDLFMYSMGEWMRTSVRRTLMVASASDPKRRAKLPEWAGDWAKNARRLTEFTQEAQGGEPAKALAAFAAFPESMKKDRMIQTLRLVAAARAGEADYLKATADYILLFPDDGYRDVPCLDALILRKEFAKALASIDRIEKLVEGDSALDLVRGRIRFMDGKNDAARELGERSMKALPAMQDPHWLMIEIALAEKKHPETLQRLKTVETTFKLEMSFEAMESTTEYAEFVKSKEYLEWKKEKGAK